MFILIISSAFSIFSLHLVFIQPFKYHVLNILVVLSSYEVKNRLIQSHSTTYQLLSKFSKLSVFIWKVGIKCIFYVTMIIIKIIFIHLLSMYFVPTYAKCITYLVTNFQLSCKWVLLAPVLQMRRLRLRD